MLALAFVLVLLIPLASAIPIAQPTITSISYPNVLTFPRSFMPPGGCLIGNFLVLTGGYNFNSPTQYFKNVDVIDITSGALVGAGNLSIARSNHMSARFGENQCLVVGGTSLSAELITIDATGAFVSVQNVSEYPDTGSSPSAEEGICLTLINNNVWCGGALQGIVVPTAATFNGTDWVQVDFPVAWYAEASTENTGACRLWGTDIWCCGGYLFDGAIPSFCQVLDTMTSIWSNFTVTERGHGAMSLVLFPTPKLLLFGGSNTTNGYLFSIDVFTIASGTYSLTVFPEAQAEAIGEFSTFGSISTFAFGVGFYNINNYQDGTLYGLNTFAGGVPVEYTRVGSATHSDLNNGFVTSWDDSSGAVYKNRVFVCGGYGDESLEFISACNAWDFNCLGNASNGYDSWVQTTSYVGCDMVNCHKNYFGNLCSPCDCNGQGCLDGYEGNGTCVCHPNYWGPACASFSDCSGNGLVKDGVSGDGTCLCFEGYNGTNCESGPVTCLNGATWDRTSGTCTCASGFYGSTCQTACACGVNGLCKDGNTGTGECVCAPGTYSVAGTASNCSQTCNCGIGGTCDDGNYGSGSCFCGKGTYGANCVQCPACSPVVESPTAIQIFRCDDGLQGTGQCIRLYSSASLTTSFFSLIALFFLLISLILENSSHS